MEFKSIKILLDERMNKFRSQSVYDDKFCKSNLIVEKQGYLGSYGKDIFVKLNILISDELSIELDQVKLDSHFYADLNLDAVDFTDLIMEVEVAFDIEISDEAAEEIYFVKDLLEYICSKVE